MRIGIIGCGAIAERYAGVLAHRKVQICVAVDQDEKRASTFMKRNHFQYSYRDYHDVFGKVDAAIICLPNSLHCEVATGLLENGIGVLCEKPLGLTVAEVEKMVRSSRQSQSVLAAANVRRFYWTSQKLKSIFEKHEFGRLLSIEAEEGLIFDWKTRSGFFFNKTMSGGGALIDIGAHAMDMILWWLQEYPISVTYRDDNHGGVEADSEVAFSFKNGASVTLSLSWLRALRNVYRVAFERATILYWPHDYNRLAISTDGLENEVLRAPTWLSSEDYFGLMVDDFLQAVRDKHPPFVPGEETAPSIRLISACYENRRCLELPWLTSGLSMRI